MKWATGGSDWSSRHTLESLADLVTTKWPDVWPETTALFAAFMSTQHGTGVLHNRPNLDNPNSARAWPSHRTWDFGRRSWATSKILNRADNIRDSLLESCVGVGPATAFIAYAKVTDLPSPADVLSGKWKIDPDRLDIVLAAYTSATGYVAQRPDPKERLELGPKMWEALHKLREAGMEDIAVAPALTLVKAKLGYTASAAMKAPAQKVLNALYKSGLVDQHVESNA